ncbi:MAG: UDP-N-acetylglucosamine 2-epimerase (non-hydrolyzing) [Desulfobacteraceae bacterium]|nr:UDP-N-acetylglucosamine 2-epimerase (non-hydrolyzing) [Desulfobacteraceae bacterium]MBU4053940.1 UDP-N-acetylglucosamine 2-epimerase (non-hydrolyzing) [Pseudomonadota bacterium]
MKKTLDKLKVMVVMGTRPEVIKMAPVIQSLQQHPDQFQTIVVATAQHRGLLDQALSIFRIQPDLDLNLMNTGQGLPDLTGRVLSSMAQTLSKTKPDMVMVQGDTTTVLATALAAFYQKIPVAHIEAGLRTYHKYSPFPEEMNRRLTSVMADVHFAPTLSAKHALLKEGISDSTIVVTGNTVVDALLHVCELPEPLGHPVLSTLDFDQYRLLLVTSHRRESWGLELQNICMAIKEIVEKYPDVLVVYPVHPNPVVQSTAMDILGGMERIKLVEPLDYLTFIHLMKKSYMILTDSGGLQEEAPTLKKPLLLLREVTERPEAFDSGFAKIVGTNHQNIVKETEFLLNDRNAYEKMIRGDNPYGDGKAGHRIVQALCHWGKRAAPLLSSEEEFTFSLKN